MLSSPLRPPSALASVSSARPYIGEESKRLIPAEIASSTIGVRSAVVSKVCQVPIPMTGTCSVVRPSLCRSSGLLEIVDRHRFHRVGQCEAEDLRVEIQLAFERALDVLRNAEAMLPPLEGDIRNRQPLFPESRHDQLRLVRRHDLVLQALKEDDRRCDPIEVVDRGPLLIDVPLLGPPANQALVVHRLKLVGVGVKDLQVADAKMAGSGLEEMRRRQRSQYRVAAGTAARDRHPVAISQAAVNHVSSSG